MWITFSLFLQSYVLASVQCENRSHNGAFPKLILCLCYTNTNLWFVFVTHKFAVPNYFRAWHKLNLWFIFLEPTHYIPPPISSTQLEDALLPWPSPYLSFLSESKKQEGQEEALTKFHPVWSTFVPGSPKNNILSVVPYSTLQLVCNSSK